MSNANGIEIRVEPPRLSAPQLTESERRPLSRLTSDSITTNRIGVSVAEGEVPLYYIQLYYIVRNQMRSTACFIF